MIFVFGIYFMVGCITYIGIKVIETYYPSQGLGEFDDPLRKGTYFFLAIAWPFALFCFIIYLFFNSIKIALDSVADWLIKKFKK